MPVPKASRRTPPRKRFVGAEHLFDLDAEADRLNREPEGSRRGHRQITLFSGGGVSIVLFEFEADASLKDHAATGYVTVHVLSGEIEMATAEQDYRMPAGSLLVLRPNVKHDVRARMASRVLLSVKLDPATGPRDDRHG
jgi:quercetin dioxygenase-like cupin family protein